MPETGVSTAAFVRSTSRTRACRLSTFGQRKHGGDDSLANLALACDRCNFSKGPNLSGIDSDTDSIEVLFNPREQHWDDHFAYRGPLIVGRTPTGRATVVVLNMNESHRVQLREELIRAGEFE